MGILKRPPASITPVFPVMTKIGKAESIAPLPTVIFLWIKNDWAAHAGVLVNGMLFVMKKAVLF